MSLALALPLPPLLTPPTEHAAAAAGCGLQARAGEPAAAAASVSVGPPLPAAMPSLPPLGDAVRCRLGARPVSAPAKAPAISHGCQAGAAPAAGAPAAGAGDAAAGAEASPPSPSAPPLRRRMACLRSRSRQERREPVKRSSGWKVPHWRAGGGGAGRGEGERRVQVGGREHAREQQAASVPWCSCTHRQSSAALPALRCTALQQPASAMHAGCSSKGCCAVQLVYLLAEALVGALEVHRQRVPVCLADAIPLHRGQGHGREATLGQPGSHWSACRAGGQARVAGGGGRGHLPGGARRRISHTHACGAPSRPRPARNPAAAGARALRAHKLTM